MKISRWSGKRAQILTSVLRDRITVSLYPTDQTIEPTHFYFPLPAHLPSGSGIDYASEARRLARIEYCAAVDKAEELAADKVIELANEYRLGRTQTKEQVQRRRELSRVTNKADSTRWYLDEVPNDSPNLQYHAENWYLAHKALAKIAS